MRGLDLPVDISRGHNVHVGSQKVGVTGGPGALDSQKETEGVDCGHLHMDRTEDCSEGLPEEILELE